MPTESGRESVSAARERRERIALRRLAAARSSADVAGTLGAIEDLLRPLWPGMRARAAKALRPWRAQDDDLDDIAVAAMMRLLAALANERDRTVPIGALMTRSVEYEVRNFQHRRAEQAAHEELRAPEQMPE